MPIGDQQVVRETSCFITIIFFAGLFARNYARRNCCNSLLVIHLNGYIQGSSQLNANVGHQLELLGFDELQSLVHYDVRQSVVGLLAGDLLREIED